MNEIGRVPGMWRLRGERLRGPRTMFWIYDGDLVVEKLGIRRTASLGDEDGVWKILTNDMEFSRETAEKIISEMLGLLQTDEG